MWCSKILFITAMLFLSSYCSMGQKAGNGYQAKWLLLKSSSLKVDGSTNINKFSCEIAQYTNPDTLIVYRHNNGENFLPFKGHLTLEVNQFNCHNPMMTSDLRKTMKAKEFPQFHIRFFTLSKIPDLKLSNTISNITGKVEIELSGVVKNYDIAYSISTEDNKTVHLIGRQTVTFTEFGLIPPRKLGGMIRAKDELEVSFHLWLKPIE